MHNIQSIVNAHPILAGHPYFNQDFVTQYQIQDESYKRQQQAQLVQNLTKHIETADTTHQQQDQGISKEVMGTTGLNTMLTGEEHPVDYQQKVLIDEETQEVHRKLLE